MHIEGYFVKQNIRKWVIIRKKTKKTVKAKKDNLNNIKRSPRCGRN